MAGLFTRIDDAWHSLLLALAGMPDEAMMEPKAVGEWSVKDVMGHISAWEDAYVEATVEFHRGLRPKIFDIDWDREGDQVNARLQQERAKVPLDQTWRNLGRSHRAFVQALGNPEVLNEPDLFALAQEISCKHYDHHAADVRRFRPAQFPEVGVAYHAMKVGEQWPDPAVPAHWGAFSGSCEYLMAALEPLAAVSMANKLYEKYEGKLAMLIFDLAKLQPEAAQPNGRNTLTGHIHGWFNLKALMDVRPMARDPKTGFWAFPRF